MNLTDIADCPELLEVARLAIEDVLIDMRDSRISMFGRGNGLVVKESDGTESSIIRMGPEAAVQIGLRAIAKRLETAETKPRIYAPP